MNPFSWQPMSVRHPGRQAFMHAGACIYRNMYPQVDTYSSTLVDHSVITLSARRLLTGQATIAGMGTYSNTLFTWYNLLRVRYIPGTCSIYAYGLALTKLPKKSSYNTRTTHIRNYLYSHGRSERFCTTLKAVKMSVNF